MEGLLSTGPTPSSLSPLQNLIESKIAKIKSLLVTELIPTDISPIGFCPSLPPALDRPARAVEGVKVEGPLESDTSHPGAGRGW